MKLPQSVEEEFDEKFVRDDGLMDKYGYDKNGDPEALGVLIKDFLSQKLKERDEEIIKIVENALTPHGYVSDDPKIERIVQDEKLKILSDIIQTIKGV